MAEKMIKFRLFHFYVEEEGADGQTVLTERNASYGQTVDIPRDADVERGEELGAFYTDEEIEAIKDGSYEGEDAEQIAARLSGGAGFPGVPPFSDAEGYGGQMVGGYPVGGMSADELSDFIQENELDDEAIISLSGGDPEQAEKVLDAVNMGGSASDEVVEALEGISAGPARTESALGGSPPLAPELQSGETTEGAPAKNASKAEWQEYAELQGIEFGEDATRDDIIASVLEAQQAKSNE